MLKRTLRIGVFLLMGSIVACTDLFDADGPWTGVRGSGRLATESRPVRDIYGVALSGAGRLIIEQTGRESLEITAEDNILPLLTTEVVSGRLLLGTAPNTSLSPTREIVYRLTVRSLSDITISGAGNVEAHGIDAEFLSVVVSGAGRVEAEGAVGRLEVTLSGAASFGGRDLVSSVASVIVSGVGHAEVNVRRQLDGSVSGVGLLRYYGNPTVRVVVSGEGRVEHVWH